MYYLKGGGMTVRAGQPTRNLISDDGVTLQYPGPGFSYSKLSVTGGSTTT